MAFFRVQLPGTKFLFFYTFLRNVSNHIPIDTEFYIGVMYTFISLGHYELIIRFSSAPDPVFAADQTFF